MIAVIPSTNRDNSKIELAGVDAGAKIFVGLKRAPDSAKAVPARQHKTMTTPGKRLLFELFEILICCGMFTNSSCVPTCKIRAERRRRARIFANRESQTCYADRVCVSWRSSRYGSGSGLPLTNPLAFRDSAYRQESEEFTSPNRSATPNCEN